MSKALTKKGEADNVAGIVPAAASVVVPGLGQLLNGEPDKALGVFVVAGVAGLGIWAGLPLIGAAASLVYGGTVIYAAADGFLTGRKK